MKFERIIVRAGFKKKVAKADNAVKNVCVERKRGSERPKNK